MFRVFLSITLTFFTLSCSKTRTITVDKYIDKMKGGWVGQMVGDSKSG